MRRYTLLAIVCAAICIRLTLFVILEAQIGPEAFLLTDSHGYERIAQNIISGNGFSMAAQAPYLPDSVRVPVIPLLLAGTLALFGSVTPFVVFQILMTAGLVVLTHRLALLLTGKESLAIAAAALMAFEPYAVFVNLSILTETLFILLITAAFNLAALYARDAKLYPLLGSSALLGVAALTRPIAEFSLIILVAIVLWREPMRRYALYLAAAVIPFMLVVSPWLVRNYVVFGMPGLSSGGLQNLYSDFGGSVVSYRDHGGWRDAKNALESDFAARHQIPVSTIQQNLDLSPVLFAEGLSLLVHNPLATAKVFTSATLTFFTNDAWGYYVQHWGWMQPFQSGFSPTQSLLQDGPVLTFHRVLAATNGPSLFVAVLGRLFWIGITLFGVAGLWVMIRTNSPRRIYAFMIIATVLYYLGLSASAGAGVNGRYRYPLDPLLFPVALVAIYELAARARTFWRVKISGTPPIV